MKKKTLKEEIERIHSITYGKKIIYEQEFLDKISKFLGGETNKVDDPKKADFVSTDVNDFYKTLESASTSGGLKQQEHGSMVYQKEVEAMQIALEILGYELPKFGIDGLFGPETASAVMSFKSDKRVLSEDSSDMRNTISSLGYTEKGNELSSGGEITDELSTIVSKILKEFKLSNPNVDIKITSGNDKFHKDLKYQSKHTEGKAIDLVLSPYNSTNASAFKHVLDTYKSKDSKFTYIDEYTHQTEASTGGHFHLQYGTGVAVNRTGIISASSDMLTLLLKLLKEKGNDFIHRELPKYIDEMKKNINFNVNIKDWMGMINLIINKLEGGYYHPDMLQDGRVKDNRYGDSGETMFGIDRKNGGPELSTHAGKEFWNLIDRQNARRKWPNEYMVKDNPVLSNQLRELVGGMMKPLYEEYSHKFLSPEANTIVQNYPPLTFNFVYATFNGPGWFKKFSQIINDAVVSGKTDPKELLRIVLDRRNNSGNSLIAQTGNKVTNIANQIASTSV